MTVLLEQLAALFRDPLEVDEHAGDMPVPSLAQLETTLIWALRDGQDEFAALLAAEIRRIREGQSAQLEAILIGNSAGTWRIH